MALLTERIINLTEHFKAHGKGNHSRRGLLKMVSHRRHLLDHVKGKYESRYKADRAPRQPAANRPRRRPVRSAASALLIAVCTTGAAAWSSPFGVLTPALQRFGKLATDKRPRDLPRLADPQAAPVLRTLWAGAEPDYTTLPDVTSEAMVTTTIEVYELDVLKTYLDFPAKPAVIVELPAIPPSPADSDHLATLFGPELAYSLAASVAAIAHVSVTAEHAVTRQPAPEAANLPAYARQAREPNLRIVALAQTFMAAPAFGPDNVARVAAAFADHGPDFALVLSRADRAGVAAAFATIAQKQADGRARRDLSRFVDELHAAPCGPLCGVP